MIRVAKDMETDDGTERDRKGEACRLFPFRYFLGSVVIIILALPFHPPFLPLRGARRDTERSRKGECKRRG